MVYTFYVLFILQIYILHFSLLSTGCDVIDDGLMVRFQKLNFNL